MFHIPCNENNFHSQLFIGTNQQTGVLHQESNAHANYAHVHFSHFRNRLRQISSRWNAVFRHWN